MPIGPDDVPLELLPDSWFLSILHTLGFTVDQSLHRDVRGNEFSGWSTDVLIDEARRRGFKVDDMTPDASLATIGRTGAPTNSYTSAAST